MKAKASTASLLGPLVDHVVIIIKENHTYDYYFGTNAGVGVKPRGASLLYDAGTAEGEAASHPSLAPRTFPFTLRYARCSFRPTLSRRP